MYCWYDGGDVYIDISRLDLKFHPPTDLSFVKHIYLLLPWDTWMPQDRAQLAAKSNFLVGMYVVQGEFVVNKRLNINISSIKVFFNLSVESYYNISLWFILLLMVLYLSLYNVQWLVTITILYSNVYYLLSLWLCFSRFYIVVYGSTMVVQTIKYYYRSTRYFYSTQTLGSTIYQYI